MGLKHILFIGIGVVFSVLMIGVLTNQPVFTGGGIGDTCADCLVVYNLEEYLDVNLLQKFEAYHRQKVILKEFETIEQIYQAVLSDPDAVDVIIIDGFYVSQLKDNNVLMRLDQLLLPNSDNIDPRFRDFYFDEGNVYSYPYFWGSTGIAYNKKYVDSPVDSWNVFWNPRYAGRMSMLDDNREVSAIGLRKLGYSQNSEDPKEIASAKEHILRLNVNVLPAIDVISFLTGREGYISHAYSGDAAAAMRANPDIMYVIPKEGGTFWVDNFAISKYSTHQRAAHAFINFMLKPENAAANVNYVKYASPLKRETYEHLVDPSILDNPVIYPSDEAIKRLQIMEKINNEDLHHDILESYKQEKITNGLGIQDGLGIITTTV